MTRIIKNAISDNMHRPPITYGSVRFDSAKTSSKQINMISATLMKINEIKKNKTKNNNNIDNK
jgi:hypothetical protein